jgi:hypothetical protein
MKGKNEERQHTHNQRKMLWEREIYDTSNISKEIQKGSIKGENVGGGGGK